MQTQPTNLVYKDLMEPGPLPISPIVKPLPMTTVLLTGATGYLGSHVLYELLVSTKAHIYCLIRPSEKSTLEDKLMESMQFYFGHNIGRHMQNRVTIIKGDLGKKKTSSN
ncbi:SDR family oxidoreductase [Lysinibacillus sp. MHQ-1]|nr:SDR family oxidoreductase [Lysinibacillus sp. MHQ-1]